MGSPLTNFQKWNIWTHFIKISRLLVWGPFCVLPIPESMHCGPLCYSIPVRLERSPSIGIIGHCLLCVVWTHILRIINLNLLIWFQFRHCVSHLSTMSYNTKEGKRKKSARARTYTHPHVRIHSNTSRILCTLYTCTMDNKLPDNRFISVQNEQTVHHRVLSFWPK